MLNFSDTTLIFYLFCTSLFQDLVDKFARPQTPADVKLHPHFVSQNDILKYEAIYPNDCQPLYLIRNAPVYSRFDLHGVIFVPQIFKNNFILYKASHQRKMDPKRNANQKGRGAVQNC